MQNRTDAVFTPYAVGSCVLKNRLVALPVYTGYAHSNEVGLPASKDG